mmetsp:Transcript_20659/g.46071  ORF Transcript_20659/g.46071 Transcript_20659/m.46071 type:complete len:259 (+) Transcript_20659:3016-3792(+)
MRLYGDDDEAAAAAADAAAIWPRLGLASVVAIRGLGCDTTPPPDPAPPPPEEVGVREPMFCLLLCSRLCRTEPRMPPPPLAVEVGVLTEVGVPAAAADGDGEEAAPVGVAAPPTATTGLGALRSSLAFLPAASLTAAAWLREREAFWKVGDDARILYPPPPPPAPPAPYSSPPAAAAPPPSSATVLPLDEPLDEARGVPPPSPIWPDIRLTLRPVLGLGGRMLEVYPPEEGGLGLDGTPPPPPPAYDEDGLGLGGGIM